MSGVLRAAGAALATAAVLVLAGCAARSEPQAVASDGAVAAGPGDTGEPRPVVQVPAADAPAAFLDPDAAPRTDLGRLRARHLPVWTPEFDWAFPPDACGTAWELDGIAEPAGGADLAVLGDPASAAALSVMRYEFQLSRALAEPSPLLQICVATASVGPARSDALAVLESYLATGARRREPAVFPEEVWILAAGPAVALAVACVTPGYPAVAGTDGEAIEQPRAPARLQAYLLTVSAGLEDRIADVSYRVSDAGHRPAPDCLGLDDWILEWQAHVRTWIDEGRIWSPLVAAVTARGLCDAPPPDGPDECPEDWIS